MARNSKSSGPALTAQLGRLPVWAPLLGAALIVLLIGQRAPLVATIAVLPLLITPYLRVRNSSNRARALGRVSVGDVKQNLSLMSWSSLQRMVTALYEQRGFTPLEVSRAAPEGGVDLAFRSDEGLFFVSCKHTPSKQVPVNVVRDLYGTMATQRAGGGAVVNVGGFAPDAVLTAKKLGIEILDSDALAARLQAKPPALLFSRAAQPAALALLAVYVALAVAAVTVNWTRWIGVLQPVAQVAEQQSNQPVKSLPNAATLALQQARHDQEQRNYARAAADAARLQIAEDKVASWERSFKASRQCEDPTNWKVQVECGNEYIRAKKKFDQDWEAAHPAAQGAR